MRKLLSSALIIAVLATALVNLSSCEKDEGKLPNINFKTGGTYTSADLHLDAGDVVTVGIHATKSEGEDVLKTLNESVSVNGATATTVQTITIPSAQEDEYNNDFNITAAGASGTTLKYIFTVTNRDGLTNAVSLTLTVN
jgi:hypothetical protein